MNKQQIQILWVDRDVKSHKEVIDYLHQTNGLHIDTATKRQEALEALKNRRRQYNVVFLGDLLNPPGNRIEKAPSLKFLTEIKNLYPDLEVIVSPNQEQNFEIEALEAGALYYLHPPLEPKKLALIIYPPCHP